MKKELLYSLTKKDFKLQTFRSGGPGGQHQNKTDSGVRIIHKDSGAVGESREHKSQRQNRKAALKRLVEHSKFKLWNTRKCHEIISGKTLDEIVEEMMNDKNLKVEIINDEGKWEKWKE
ncbi:MAG: peptide chain release factor family protein [Candidatus Heimdallarchaeaceae archaeon]